MPDSPYTNWQPGGGTGSFLFEQLWVGSSFLDKPFPAQISWSQRVGNRLTEMHSGNHARTGTYRGDKAPDVYSHFTFSFTFRHKYDSDYLAWQRLFAGGSTFDFAFGLIVVEEYEATSGNTYTLSRPEAAGTVTGVTQTTHPTKVYLDGSEDAGAASISGQTVTANNTGTIRIEYTPLFNVEFGQIDTTVVTTNVMDTSISLIESISGDFE